MSDIIENNSCYFCDQVYPYHSCFIENKNGLWFCKGCERIIPVNNIQEFEECSVCFEYKSLIKLPTCIHKLCLDCCKTIYFGSSSTQPPIHLCEMTIECPSWPYEINDDNNNDPEFVKYNEYCDFDIKYFDIETNNYDELIEIRNKLIPERPVWMNTAEIINYENNNFRYHTECIKSDKEWEIYNENKTKGNSCCPLCREKP